MTRPASFTSTPTDLGSSSGPGLRRARRAIALGAAATGLALVAGCTTMSPSQTLVPYQPADGVALNVGEVQVRDLLLIASAKGATGVLSGSLINTGTTSVTVSFAAAPTAEAPTSTKAPTTLRLGPREQKRITDTQIPAVSAAPGALTQVVMTTNEGEGVATVPVLLPTGYYSTLTPSPTPTDTATTTAPGPATSAAPTDPATTPAG
ncbi:MAG: hypothetical protein M3Y71_19745 [Actinomycetota bacterium]|nr:hypothetical protein [Actinomycetota bacterium]